MNEYIALDLMKQRSAERREEAKNAHFARSLRLARRRHQREDDLVTAPIPDYVDGSFCPADEAVADNTVQARHESAAR